MGGLNGIQMIVLEKAYFIENGFSEAWAFLSVGDPITSMAVASLEKDGLIESKKVNGGVHIRATTKGSELAESFKMNGDK